MSKLILVNAQNVEISADAQTSGTGSLKVPDLAGATKYQVPAASAAHAAELAKLGVKGADIASASTTNLETATGELVDVTGTTTITAITLSEGHRRIVRFTGILTLTHGASLVLPGAANITTAAGDVAVFEGYASGVVRCVGYSAAGVSPWSGTAKTITLTNAASGTEKPVVIMENGQPAKARVAKIKGGSGQISDTLWSCLSMSVNADWDDDGTGYVLDDSNTPKSVLQMEYDYSNSGGAFTVTNSGGDALFTCTSGVAGGTAHGLSNGKAVFLYSGTLAAGAYANNANPGGFSNFTTYYVVSTSGITCKLSATYGGTPIAYSSAGSNVHVFEGMHEINWTVGATRLLHMVGLTADTGRGIFRSLLPVDIDTTGSGSTVRVEPTFVVRGKRGNTDYTTFQLLGSGSGSGSAVRFQMKTDTTDWSFFTGITSGFSVTGANTFALYDVTTGRMRQWFDANGNVGLGGSGSANCPTSFGGSAQGVLALANGVEPTTAPADIIQLFSIDHSGSTTLGLRVEKAVAADAALVSTHSLTIRINGANYKLMLVAA